MQVRMTDYGFLTDYEREFLESPETFREEHGGAAVRSVRARIRNKWAGAIHELDWLNDKEELWMSKDPGPEGESPSLPDGAESLPLHIPVPTDESTTIQVHTATKNQMAAGIEAVSENRSSSEEMTYDDFIRLALITQLQLYEMVLEEYGDTPEYREYFTDGQLGMMYLLTREIDVAALKRT